MGAVTPPLATACICLIRHSTATMQNGYLNTAANQPAPALPEEDYHASTPAEEYDLNYVFPVEVLESNALRLEPFIPSLHAEAAWEIFKTPEGRGSYRFMPFNPPDTFTAFLTEVESHRRTPGWLTLAIIDKTRPKGQNLAGMTALINSNPAYLWLEIGAVHVFPAFQRTHVNSHTNGLLLRYAFNVLRLRRVVWRANTLNEPSMAAAKRLGFNLEGVLEWDVALPPNKEGLVVEDKDGLGRSQAGPGRHSAQFGMNWKMWKENVSRHIDGLMDRPVRARATQ